MPEDFESQRLAGSEDHRGRGGADEQIVARAGDQQAGLATLERHVVELAGNIGEGDFDLRRLLRGVGGGELHDEFGVGGSGDDEVDAVVGPRRSLADHEAAVFQPHRARLIGLDSQRARLGDGPAADGDRAFPQFFSAAAPGDANHDGLVGVSKDRRQPEQTKNQSRQDRDAAGRVAWRLSLFPCARGRPAPRSVPAGVAFFSPRKSDAAQSGRRGRAVRAATGR